MVSFLYNFSEATQQERSMVESEMAEGYSGHDYFLKQCSEH